MHRLTSELDAEKVRVETALAATTPAPSQYEEYVMRKTLDAIARMLQAPGESETDWRLRVNTIIQQAPAGFWSTSFWASVSAAIAADTAIGPRGGVGRGES